MESLFMFQWLFASVVILVVTALGVAVIWKRTRVGSKGEATPVVGPRVLEVKLDILEIPAIRTLLGTEVANNLLNSLGNDIQQTVHLARAPQIGSDSILFAALVSDETEPDLLVQQLIANVSRSTTISGLEFRCSVAGQIIAHGATAENAQARNVALLQEFTQAIESNRLTLAYQPKLDLRSNTISSVEALLRWTSKKGDPANIAQLIELLEKTGTIKAMSLWGIEQAIADGEKMLEAGFDIQTFVNISAGLLADAAFTETLIASASNTPAKIGIEITETAIIADPAIAIQNLQAISQAGIAIAIDDFGVGLSSLEYLQQLPASELKIDRSFIASLSSSNRNPLIVRATIDLAHALEMSVTAEGVDDQLSVALLRIMGCDMAQGYLVSPALPVNELIGFLQDYQTGSEEKAGQTKPAAAGG
jgi:EAL domain-containing protein (putative c-di-GMP-specific phosphodiesterase class I)